MKLYYLVRIEIAGADILNTDLCTCLRHMITASLVSKEITTTHHEYWSSVDGIIEPLSLTAHHAGNVSSATMLYTDRHEGNSKIPVDSHPPVEFSLRKSTALPPACSPPSDFHHCTR